MIWLLLWDDYGDTAGLRAFLAEYPHVSAGAAAWRERGAPAGRENYGCSLGDGYGINPISILSSSI